MRRDPLLRWIEQAEARKVADAALFEPTTIASAEHQRRQKPVVQYRQPRRLWPLLRRLRPFRAANDTY